MTAPWLLVNDSPEEDVRQSMPPASSSASHTADVPEEWLGIQSRAFALIDTHAVAAERPVIRAVSSPFDVDPSSPCIAFSEHHYYQAFHSIYAWKSLPLPAPTLTKAEEARKVASTWKRLVTLNDINEPALHVATETANVREAFEEVLLAAEATLRILRTQLSQHSEIVPENIAQLLATAGNSLDSDVIASAGSLIAGVVKLLPDVDLPEIDVFDDALEVTWSGKRSLLWVIRKPPFSWPGVRVRAHSLSGNPTTRSFVLAHQVIEHACSLLV